MKKLLVPVIMFVSLFAAGNAWAHCEVPCGIYDDDARFTELAEHITTMEKAMKNIVELGQQSPTNYNQIVRWVTTKDDHAEKFQYIVSQYFMTQTIKPVDPSDKKAYSAYLKKIELAHHLLVYSMKAKQGTDLEVIKTLRSKLEAFKKAYTHHDH